MVKTVYILVLIGLVAVSNVSALKCYVCKNCTDPKTETECKTDDLNPKIETTLLPVTTEAIETTENSSEPPTTPDKQTFERANTEAPTGSNYKCYKQVEGDVINRGCTADTTKEETDKLYICDKDLCNPATNIKSWALGTVMLVTIIKMVF